MEIIEGRVQGAGMLLSYTEHGSGAPVLLIHDVAGDAAGLSPLAEALAEDARVIAYDRRGYGASEAPEPYEATTVSEQAEDAAALLGALKAAPAVLCGAGLGALIALDLLVRQPGLVRAAVLADPPLYSFVPEATEVLSEQRSRLEAALREGGSAAGVASVFDSADHASARALTGDGARSPTEGGGLGRAQAAHRAVFADLTGLTSWPVTRGALRAIAAPVFVLTGPETPAHVGTAADALAALLARARRSDEGDLAAAVRTLL